MIKLSREKFHVFCLECCTPCKHAFHYRDQNKCVYLINKEYREDVRNWKRKIRISGVNI